MVTWWPNVISPSFKELCSLLYSPTKSIFISLCVTTKVAYLNEVKNIHICLVTISLAKGGAERAVANQSRMWHDMGARVTIVVLNHEIAYPYAGQIWSLDRKKSQKVSFGRWSRFQQLKKFLKTEQPDFVIDHRPKDHRARKRTRWGRGHLLDCRRRQRLVF